MTVMAKNYARFQRFRSYGAHSNVASGFRRRAKPRLAIA